MPCFILPVPYGTHLISKIGTNSGKIFSDMSCRSRLAVLNEKLTTLERKIEYLEARVSNTYQ